MHSRIIELSKEPDLKQERLLIAMEIGPAPVIWAGLGSPATTRTSELGTMRYRSS